MIINTINQQKKHVSCLNLTENVEDQQVNNTQNHEAIIMLPPGAVGRIIGQKSKQTSTFTNKECINHNNQAN